MKSVIICPFFKIIFVVILLTVVPMDISADDITIDSSGNMITGTSATDGNLEVTGSSGEDGVVGVTSGVGAGVYGENTTSGNSGLLGDDECGVYGASATGWAGYFQGHVNVTGNLDVGGVLTGYTETDPVFGASTAFGITAGEITKWDSAYGWGDHAAAGYLTGETDPVFGASTAFGITAGQITNWDAAFGWGDHAAAGYDTSHDSWTGTGDIYMTSGKVGIGTASPTKDLHIVGDAAIGSIIIAPDQGLSGADSELILAEDSDGTYNMKLNYDGGTNQMYIYGTSSTSSYGPHMAINRNNGYVGIGTTSPTSRLTVRGNITIEDSAGTTIAEFGEGLDYAEGFDISDRSDIARGTVLVIDPEYPGKLKISTEEYDTKVAGIVAGANGLGSGVRLGAGKFDSDVALAGRVYCNADATEYGIEPGDLLTTASLSGHAMKAFDYNRAKGAILGKAMEKLEKGKKGQILVLVTLQ